MSVIEISFKKFMFGSPVSAKINILIQDVKDFMV